MLARIRTIKPEFWTSAQVAECSTNARLLFVGLWNFCDDGGIHPASVKRLRMEVFPGDPFRDADIQKLIDELIRSKLIVEFESQGEAYWCVTGWHHQKIDRPSRKYPQPTLADISSNARRIIDDHSPPEGKGGEGSLREGNGREDDCSEPPHGDSEQPSSAVIMVFPCVGKGPTEWPLVDTKVREYEQSFPGVDVLGECRKARQWCIDNSTKRKTATGMPSFLSRWLSKCQNSGTSNANSRGNYQKPPDPTRVHGTGSDPYSGII